MEFECLKLHLQPNPRNNNIDWRLEMQPRENMTMEVKATLQRMEKCFEKILKLEKKLAPLPSKHLTLHEPMVPYQISQYEIGGWVRYEVARFSRNQGDSLPFKFGLLRIYPELSAATPQFFYLLLKVILTYFDASKPRLSECLLGQEGWEFLFNDVVIRKYFFADPLLSDAIGECYGILKA